MLVKDEPPAICAGESERRSVNPTGWLITAATRRWIEIWRSDVARRRREDAVAAQERAMTVEVSEPSAHDDSLTLLFLCCHPALTPVSQVALTLRAVGGLTTAEIARALLVPEPTVAQHISRAKAQIRTAGAELSMPEPADRPRRLAAVLHVLCLVFNEGYTASSGKRLHRVELSGEAIRLAGQLQAQLPDEGEVAGLLALMLLTDARRPARTSAAGSLIPLLEQDRSRWDTAMIARGCALLSAHLPTSTIGSYQLQAAIAAVHDDASRAGDTDWPQTLGLDDLLVTVSPGPTVTLNRIVALAMVRGPEIGLAALNRAEPSLSGHRRIPAVRAHLLELAGDAPHAREQCAVAARTTFNLAEREYLQARAGPPAGQSSSLSDRCTSSTRTPPASLG